MSEPEFSRELVERCLTAMTHRKAIDCESAVIAVLRESRYAALVAVLQWILSASADVSDADYRTFAMQFARDALRKAGSPAT